MNLWSDIKRRVKKNLYAMGLRVALATSDKTPPPAGRTSLDSELSTTLTNKWTITAPDDYQSHWRWVNMDIENLDEYSAKDLIDMLADVSPELSRAMWDFNRFCNPGWEVKIFNLGDEDALNPEGTEHVADFFERLRKEYGSVDIVLDRIFTNAYWRGAICSELVLDGEAFESLDIAVPDPFSVRFRRKLDPVRKEIWEAGQWQNGKFVSLAIPTFWYLPVDPAPASPYGRPLAAPALFTLIFLLSLLHDVKRVVMQQGYKRMDIVLNMEAALDAFSYDQQGYETFGAYTRGAIEAVRSAYRSLKPDDAFIHTDLFSLEPPAGTIDSDSISAISTIIERLEKMATRALKSNSLLMDTGASPSETDSNRRWEIHVAGIKAIQHLVENMLESMLLVSLQAKGIQARVEFRFSELRASEMLRDEQTRQMRLQNNIGEYQAGFVSQNEASNNQVNHDADQQKPRGPVESDGLVQDNSSGEENLPMNSDDRKVKNTLQRILELLQESAKVAEDAPVPAGGDYNGFTKSR